MAVLGLITAALVFLYFYIIALLFLSGGIIVLKIFGFIEQPFWPLMKKIWGTLLIVIVNMKNTKH